MDKKYTGKDGISIKLITNKIQSEINRKIKKNKETKAKLKKSYTPGTLKSDDFQIVSTGLSLLSDIIDKGFDSQKDKLLLGEKDLSKFRAKTYNYKNIINTSFRELERLVMLEYNIRQQIETLESIADVAQAARDGIILKQETRYETVNGKEKRVTYDTSMTDKEIMAKFERYDRLSDNTETKKIRVYVQLGMGLAGILGTAAKSVISSRKNQKEIKDRKGALIGMCGIASAAIPLIPMPGMKKQREKGRYLRNKSNNLNDNAIYNEQISINSKKNAIETANQAQKDVLRFEEKQELKCTSLAEIAYLVTAIVTAAYVKPKLKINENGKIDGKSLAQALLSLQLTKGSVESISRGISQLRDIENTSIEYKRICKELSDIISQMEEKVYPLEGAKKPFKKLEIKNFEGKFYPKKNYETDEVSYSTKITVPEFSIKKGETVLLSGESGTGKSTFLRLLKRGDINNQKCIKLDDTYEVDNLGNQYISFRPDIELGNETNILFQITGKESISDLDKEEKERLIKIMKELELDSGLNSNKLLEQMASKKFMEYSTGQQKRLALSKLFYRINDGTSAIIVDEPVGNVEDRLIRQQLEMIKSYAKKQDVMLLIVTHRLDAVKDMVDKRYNIDNNGLMKEIPVVKEMDER